MKVGGDEWMGIWKLRLVNWETANKEEGGEVKREVVKVDLLQSVSF